MKQQWLKIAAKIDALTLRERVIVFVALVAVVVYGMFALSVDVLQTRQEILRAQIAKQRAEIAELQPRTGVPQRKQVDPPRRAVHASITSRGRSARLKPRSKPCRKASFRHNA